MCTYHGILEEYPLISIDSFESHNYTSTMFFITHIHMDHLVGLERPQFGNYVAKINAPIYMSEISKQMLSTMSTYRHLIPYFKSVPIDQPFALTIQSNDPVQAKKRDGGDIQSLRHTLSSHTPNVGETIVVTCFGSGHCPGSIMVWIEGRHGNVLFTGDFRLYRGQAKRLLHLHRRRTDDGHDHAFKPIDNLYADMTFFRPEILHIPTREVSCQALILWMRHLLRKNPTMNFHFRTSARVGYEQIYRALFDSLGMRVHVESAEYDFFACLPSVQECLTTDSTSTCLHACRTASSNFSQPCSSFRHCDKPVRILLSIMWFTEQIAASELLVEYREYHSNFEQHLSKRCLGVQDDGLEHTDPSCTDKYLSYRLCYSLHSSFSEIVDVLKTLKPKRVTPIAAPLPTLITSKRFFRIIDYFIQNNAVEPSVAMTRRSAEQIQLKHRYESFETKLERKRRRKLFQEHQQRKANDEELDLGMDDEREQHLLRRIHSLNESTSEHRKMHASKELVRSVSLDLLLMDSAEIPFSSDPSSMPDPLNCEADEDRLSFGEIPLGDDPSCELPLVDNHRKRTLSDASSDTVDYDFDAETCAALTSQSQPSASCSPL